MLTPLPCRDVTQSRIRPAAREGADTIGYGTLPIVTASVMTGALVLLVWQYMTAGQVVEKKVPAPQYPVKKGTSRAPVMKHAPAVMVGTVPDTRRRQPMVMAVTNDRSAAVPATSTSQPGHISPGKARKSNGGHPSTHTHTHTYAPAHPADTIKFE